ncbi:MAG: tetratricopeptide repeat protein [Synechococcales cyanobacterium RM1_1_8]|nr:tetratricopeptide repeat protein [Synechococcales cyanobacterium RM1_1_8]
MKGISLAIAVSLLSLGAPQLAQAQGPNHNAAAAQQQRYQEAEAVWQRIVAQQPNNAAAHYNLGIAQAQQQKWEPALESYERAIELHPSYANAHFNRGRALFKLGDFEAAGQAYRQVIALEPQNDLVQALLAELEILTQQGSNVAASPAE